MVNASGNSTIESQTSSTNFILSVTGNSIDGWDAEIHSADTTSNTLMFAFIYPSYSTSLGGGIDVTLTGSVTVTGVTLTELTNGIVWFPI